MWAANEAEREEAREASLGSFEIRRAEYVGPQVGRDLQLQALYAVLAGLAKKAFGYSPQTGFEEGIQKAVEWYKQHLDA